MVYHTSEGTSMSTCWHHWKMIGTQTWHNLQCLVQNLILLFLLTNKFPARIVPSYVIPVHMPDPLSWNGAPDGRSTVKKGYLLLSSYSDLNSSWPWKSAAPSKVMCFTWLVTKEAVLTQCNLQKRGLIIWCSRCSLCEHQLKDANHLPPLLIHLPIMAIFFFNVLSLKLTMPYSTLDFLSC